MADDLHPLTGKRYDLNNKEEDDHVIYRKSQVQQVFTEREQKNKDNNLIGKIGSSAVI